MKTKVQQSAMHVPDIFSTLFGMISRIIDVCCLCNCSENAK